MENNLSPEEQFCLKGQSDLLRKNANLPYVKEKQNSKPNSLKTIWGYFPLVLIAIWFIVPIILFVAYITFQFLNMSFLKIISCITATLLLVLLFFTYKAKTRLGKILNPLLWEHRSVLFKVIFVVFILANAFALFELDNNLLAFPVTNYISNVSLASSYFFVLIAAILWFYPISEYFIPDFFRYQKDKKQTLLNGVKNYFLHILFIVLLISLHAMLK